MEYKKEITLKNGKSALIRNGVRADGKEVFEVFNATHGETDFLLSYPEENSYDEKEEGDFLQNKTDSNNEIELLAIVDGKVVGTAGIDAVGKKYKVKHRAEFGIGILQEYCYLGIGKALMEGCIQCATKAGYKQLELEVVADNQKALGLYKSFGFIECGRNPLGFNSKISGYQELIFMRKEL